MRRALVCMSFFAYTLLPGCLAMPGDSMGGDGRPWVPPVPATGQRLPQAPAAEMEMGQPQAEQPIIEKHGVTTRDRCTQMEKRFKAIGRRIKLVNIATNPNPGATLRFICEFEGEDAQEGYFEDKRYNSSQEYDF